MHTETTTTTTNNMTERQRDAARAQKAAQEEARIAAMRTWAEAHGSELLRERLRLGFSWIALAHDEYRAAHTPAGWGDPIPVDDSQPRRSPSLDEIRAYQEAQDLVEQHNGLYSDPELRWNDDGEKKYASVMLTIHYPDGEKGKIERLIAQG